MTPTTTQQRLGRWNFAWFPALLMALTPVCLTAHSASPVKLRNPTAGPPGTAPAVTAKPSSTMPAVEPRTHSGDSPEEALRDYWRRRTDNGKEGFSPAIYAKELDHIKRMQRFDSSTGRTLPSQHDVETGLASPDTGINALSWFNLNPPNQGGRSRALIIDPVDPSIMYSASVAGGVFKSTDAGQSWFPVTDNLPIPQNLAVCSLAFDPKDHNVIYAGTGEGYFAVDYLRGDGIFRSDNAGVTWSRLFGTPTNDSRFYYVNRIAISPHDSRRLYVATRRGIFRSTDAGLSFFTIRDSSAYESQGGVLDLVIRTDVANLDGKDILFAAEAGLGTSAGRLIRTVDAAVEPSPTWNENLLADDQAGRINIAVAPSNQATIYAAVAQNVGGGVNQALRAIHRSTDGGAVFQTMFSANFGNPRIGNYLYSTINCGDGGVYYSQGGYSISLGVDPTDVNRVWVGGIYLQLSTDGGATWGVASYFYTGLFGQISPDYTHEDNHAVVFHPNYNGTTNQVMFVTSDGGVFRTANAKSGTPAYGLPIPAYCTVSAAPASFQWERRNNGFSSYQFYHGSAGGTVRELVGGTQDNGTWLYSVATGAWTKIWAGDGYASAVRDAPGGAERLYFLQDNGSGLFRKQGPAGPPTLVQPPDSLKQLVAPLVLDPLNPDIAWWGGSQLWRAQDGVLGPSSWTSVGPNMQQYRTTAIAVWPGSSRVLVAAAPYMVGPSSIWRSSSGMGNPPTWEPVPATASGFVSCIAYDPDSMMTAYYTSSTTSANPVPHVYRSTNGGETFTGISSGLPNVAANWIRLFKSGGTTLAYVGTDLGVFVAKNPGVGTPTWLVEAGVPATEVDAIVDSVEGSVRKIYAFTHGRGVYSVSVCGVMTVTAPSPLEVYQSGCASPENVVSINGLQARGTGLCEVEGQNGQGVKVGYRTMAGEFSNFLNAATVSCSPATRQDTQYLGNNVTATTMFMTGTPTGSYSLQFRFRNDLTGQIVPANGTLVVRRQGDLDHSGVIDVFDVVILSSFIVGNVQPGVAPFLAKVVAANCDHLEPIDVFDLLLLQGFVVGNVSCLTPSGWSCGGQAVAQSLGEVVVASQVASSKAGSEVRVSIDLSQAIIDGRPAELGGFLIDAVFDKEAIELVAAEAGSDPFIREVVATDSKAANRAGVVRVVGGHGGFVGSSGKVHVATLKFVERRRGGAESVRVTGEQVATVLRKAADRVNPVGIPVRGGKVQGGK